MAKENTPSHGKSGRQRYTKDIGGIDEFHSTADRNELKLHLWIPKGELVKFIR